MAPAIMVPKTKPNMTVSRPSFQAVLALSTAGHGDCLRAGAERARLTCRIHKLLTWKTQTPLSQRKQKGKVLRGSPLLRALGASFGSCLVEPSLGQTEPDDQTTLRLSGYQSIYLPLPDYHQLPLSCEQHCRSPCGLDSSGHHELRLP